MAAAYGRVSAAVAAGTSRTWRTNEQTRSATPPARRIGARRACAVTPTVHRRRKRSGGPSARRSIPRRRVGRRRRPSEAPVSGERGASTRSADGIASRGAHGRLAGDTGRAAPLAQLVPVESVGEIDERQPGSGVGPGDLAAGPVGPEGAGRHRV